VPPESLAEVTIPLRSNDEAILVLGPYDRYAKLLREALEVEIFDRRGNICIKGPDASVQEARSRVEHLLGKARKGRNLGMREIEAILLGAPPRTDGATGDGAAHGPSATARSRPAARFRVRPVDARGENQRRYLEMIASRTLTFGIGAAGTGKTFLAVASAVRLLRLGEIRRLVITRPVVEAGEHLGFLPGDVQAKLNPYMRPVYDALFELIEGEDLPRLEESGVIEVAPLAYMRGRTLSHAFVILDEGQNTTIGQMKMFLTRLGEGSCMVVTGDPSQNDLPQGKRSGLNDAVARLRGFEGVGVVEFTTDDIVRHPLVAHIVRAYQAPSKERPHEGDED